MYNIHVTLGWCNSYIVVSQVLDMAGEGNIPLFWHRNIRNHVGENWPGVWKKWQGSRRINFKFNKLKTYYRDSVIRILPPPPHPHPIVFRKTNLSGPQIDVLKLFRIWIRFRGDIRIECSNFTLFGVWLYSEVFFHMRNRTFIFKYFCIWIRGPDGLESLVKNLVTLSL